MTPGIARFYACPHCGKKKAMFSMLSYNTFDETLWSDARRFNPMCYTLSVIQRCDACNTYSLLSEWKEGDYDRDNYNGTTGQLTYEETKEAYLNLTASRRYENRDILIICLEYVRSYNDQFRREGYSPVGEEISREGAADLALFMKATDEAIKLLPGNKTDYLILKAELYRERGDFESAREFLMKAYIKRHRWVIEPMLYFCNRSDSAPFLLIEKGRNIDWSQSPDYESIVKDEVAGNREGK